MIWSKYTNKGEKRSKKRDEKKIAWMVALIRGVI